MALCHIFRQESIGISATRTETNGYDDLSRLKSVNYGDGGTQSYASDPMGNRLSRQDSAAGTTNSTYNHANMLLTAGGNSYTNDADGDTLTAPGRAMTWDSQNRMASCTVSALFLLPRRGRWVALSEPEGFLCLPPVYPDLRPQQ